MEDRILLTNGEHIIDPETEDWLNRLCGIIKETVGGRPIMRIYPYRKDLCNYLAADFDMMGGPNCPAQQRKWFSLTIAVAPCGKMSLDLPKIGHNEVVPTIRDSFDAITIVAHLACRLKANIAFNLPLACREPPSMDVD